MAQKKLFREVAKMVAIVGNIDKTQKMLYNIFAIRQQLLEAPRRMLNDTDKKRRLFSRLFLYGLSTLPL